MKRIAVFASGGGTDFQSVIDANERENFCEIAYLIASKNGIGAIERAQKHGIKTAVFSKKDYPDLEALYAELTYLLNMNGVDYIVLAGWLKIIPESFISAFKDRIINIHPALLPAFPGAHAIRDAFEYGVKVYGVTIHRVDSTVDGGAIIAQEAVPYEGRDIDELTALIHSAEHRLYPAAIARLLAE